MPGVSLSTKNSACSPRARRRPAWPGRRASRPCCTTVTCIFVAVQHVLVALARAVDCDRVDVGAGALLGDRVALVALAPDRGTIHRSICRRADRGRPAGGVWTHQPSAFVTRPICSETRTCWNIVNPPPPSSVGMFIANRPSSFARSVRARLDVVGDPALVLLRMDLQGISSSSTNRRVRSWISRSSGVDPGSSIARGYG